VEDPCVVAGNWSACLQVANESGSSLVMATLDYTGLWGDTLCCEWQRFKY